VARSKKPTCSPVLVRPFTRMLRAEGGAPVEIVDRLQALESSADRMPMAELQQVVAELASVTKDPTIGLRAALYTEIGDFEVLEWVAMSCALALTAEAELRAEKQPRAREVMQ
jgi:hypothetical protein